MGSAILDRVVVDGSLQLPESAETRHDGCFHCGLPIPDKTDLHVIVEGVDQPMCCHGCQAVAEAIVASGRSQFYRFRTETSLTGRLLVPEFLRETEIYDSQQAQEQFIRSQDNELKEASLMFEGISCAACIWLIENTLAGIPGVDDVSLNYTSQRALIRWDDNHIKLSDILQRVARIGYRALPYNPELQQQRHQRLRQLQQRRLLVAGLFGMQVMMLSISLYVGSWSGIEPAYENYFRWLSLGLTLPVVFFSALPFFTSAWRDLKHFQITMDVPVTFAILIAFASSLVATYRGQGHIYFDSVVMFVFFLSTSRYFESIARQRCAATVEKLIQGLPMIATRISMPGDHHQVVSASLLEVGDQVLIAAGETVPADGVVASGNSSTDESLLSGESLPLQRGPGDRLLGGSLNLSNPLRMTVTAIGADTVLSEIHRMIERAQSDKPALARLADRIAARFIILVLIIVCGSGLWWWMQGLDSWFEIALAVLIVSCPCALSLATPTALSAALGRMQAHGLLVKRGTALESLNRVTHVVFDKTGTLTVGDPILHQTLVHTAADSDRCFKIAASLESNSEHPLAAALVRAADVVEKFPACDLINTAGAGISGVIENRRYYIGSVEYLKNNTAHTIPLVWQQRIDASVDTTVVLADEEKLLALYQFSDRLRCDATELVARLRQRGLVVSLMTGDRESVARQVAQLTHISDCRSGMTPAMKKDAVAELQAQGASVLMVGDGINDAPVLACADVSIAMGGASALAKTSADIVLLSNHLGDIEVALCQAADAKRVIRQNLAWALTYNFAAIPAAAIGLVAPWMAAIGMSLSSLLVVMNAMRLSR
jgi:Cu2+-exporting ATPase